MSRSFWSYELCHRWLARSGDDRGSVDVLLAGGIAGVATWTSIYPLDVVKTVLQAQPWARNLNRSELRSFAIARQIFQAGGVRAFYRGIGVCSIRAFAVNAVQVSDLPVLLMQVLISDPVVYIREGYEASAISQSCEET